MINKETNLIQKKNVAFLKTLFALYIANTAPKKQRSLENFLTFDYVLQKMKSN